MQLLYNIFISLYGFALKLASFFNLKARLWIDGRKNWQDKIRENIHIHDKVLWIHCSSLGEFEQGRPLIEALKTEYPNHKIAVSFFSPSGYEIRKNYDQADLVFYLPLDTKSNARQLIRFLHPEVLFLVKYEYWFNLLDALHENNIKVIGVSSIFRENQVFFRPYGKWMLDKLKTIDHFFVQNTISGELLNTAGITQFTYSGDTRFDRVKQILENDNRLPFMEEFKSDKKIIVGGSTWPVDHEMFIELIKKHPSDEWKYVFAPHLIHENEIDDLMAKSGLRSAKYSEVKSGKIQNLSDYRLIVIDTIGLLTKIYSYADMAYVGGGFGKGIHNTLEPAVFGIPVIFGPKCRKFTEALGLIEAGGGFSVGTKDEFTGKLSELMHYDLKRKESGFAAGDFVKNAPNATGIILGYLQKEIF